MSGVMCTKAPCSQCHDEHKVFVSDDPNQVYDPWRNDIPQCDNTNEPITFETVKLWMEEKFVDDNLYTREDSPPVAAGLMLTG